MEKKCLLSGRDTAYIGLLGYFKYYDFFVESINAVFHSSLTLKHIVLPLGISFFTFQQLSFLVSVQKGEETVRRFDDYCVFVLFFPQLVAGPIVLYSEMIPQFQDESRRSLNTDNLAKGIYMFCIGLFKKAAIADTLALFVDNGFGASELGFAAAWATALSYTLQIYFDFSGYSDMAIGLGKMFNIDIPCNFNSPYLSESITEFWRRWHITLGRALSTYVYIPLGGNRKGQLRTYANLMATFLVSGLWHGAAWTFVLWGGLHGLLTVIERAFQTQLSRIPHRLRVGLTFLIVASFWVLFRAESFSEAAVVYRGMITVSNIDLGQLADLAFDNIMNFPAKVDIAYLVGILVVLMVLVWKGKNSIRLFDEFQPSNRTMFYTAVLFCLSVLQLSRESIFIYFNF